MTKAEQAARTCRHFGISRQAYYRDVWKDQISDRYNASVRTITIVDPTVHEASSMAGFEGAPAAL